MLAYGTPTRAYSARAVDGFVLGEDHHEIWPLIDHDTCLVAHDKPSRPDDIAWLRRSGEYARYHPYRR